MEVKNGSHYLLMEASNHQIHFAGKLRAAMVPTSWYSHFGAISPTPLSASGTCDLLLIYRTYKGKT